MNKASDQQEEASHREEVDTDCLENSPLSYEEQHRQSTKAILVPTTIAYLLLFPLSFAYAVVSVLVFDGPRMTPLAGGSIIFLCFCVPFSIPVTIYLMWSRYSKQNYVKSRRSCLIPLYMIGVAVADFFLVDLWLNW